MNMYRAKLLNAILFFAKNTKHCNTTKLSKLLCFLDFTHFKQTGFPCIGLKYYAYPNGPLPYDFWSEVREGNTPEDFKNKLTIIKRIDDFAPNYKELEFKAVENPDMSVFTPREQKIMVDLAFIYKEANAKDISEVSHLPNQPWQITKTKRGERCLIDYLLSIDEKAEINLEEAKQSLKEHFEAVNNFHLNPTK